MHVRPPPHHGRIPDGPLGHRLPVRARAALPGVLSLALLMGTADSARAYEDQVGLSLGLGYGNTLAGDRPPHGALLGVAAGLGLDEALTLRARLDYGVYANRQVTQHRGMFGIEILYLVDVLEWVPYFGLGVAGLGWFSQQGIQPDAGAYLVGGLDYLWEREWIVGVEARALGVALAPEDDFVQLLFMLTITRQWEVY